MTKLLYTEIMIKPLIHVTNHFIIKRLLTYFKTLSIRDFP